MTSSNRLAWRKRGRRRGSRRGTRSTCSRAKTGSGCLGKPAAAIDVVPISAVTGEGLDELRECMAEELRSGEQVHQIRIPAGDGGRIAWLHARGEVLDQRMDHDALELSVRLSPDNWARFQAMEIRLSLLSRGPQLLFLVQRQFGKSGRLLDRAEALLELPVRFAKSGFGLNLEVACEVDDGKQQVAKLIEHPVVIGFGVELGQFLVDLGARARRVGPVEADASGASLELRRAFERRKRKCNTGQRAVVARFLALSSLDFFPQMMTAMLHVAEDVRVAAFHLVADAADDVLERELAGFFGHSRMKDDLELEIAEFVGERVHVVARDRVGDFVRFLDRVGRDRLETSGPCPIRSR